MEWTPDQQRALEALGGRNNVFITGGAGTGKSTVIQHFIQHQLRESQQAAVLASTGTAAILLGGRTFHSFFGLGIMEGGVERVVERATAHKGIVQRLKKTDVVLIDEVSMIGANELHAAERIARKARKLEAPWGGLRVVMVGDFAQLPPVMPPAPRFSGADAVPLAHATPIFDDAIDSSGPARPWAFASETWRKTELDSIVLGQIVRSQESSWNEILGEVRWADVSERGVELLESRLGEVPLEFQGTRLFARRAQVEALNQQRLHRLSGAVREYNTIYLGRANRIDEIKRNAPIPEVLALKDGALVMFRQNDPEYRFVNGTLGFVRKLPDPNPPPNQPPNGQTEPVVTIELVKGGKLIELKRATYSLLDAEGQTVASASNYPLNLAWACTIHKAQGATLDRVHVNLRGVWEHGQTYVALSRVRAMADLTLEGLSQKVFIADPSVRDFYRGLARR